jgi:hypothetical protein
MWSAPCHTEQQFRKTTAVEYIIDHRFSIIVSDPISMNE